MLLSVLQCGVPTIPRVGTQRFPTVGKQPTPNVSGAKVEKPGTGSV